MALLAICLQLLAQHPSNNPDSMLIMVEPIHTLNSGKSEYAPFLWKNKLYFISNRNNHFALYLSDKSSRNVPAIVFQPEHEPGTYAIPQHLAHKINSKYNEGPFCFTDAGIYITCNQTNRNFTESSPPLEIRFSSYSGEKGFTEAKRIPIALPENVSFGHPTLVHENMLIFSAKTNSEKVDLFYSIREDNYWKTPVNISSLNTLYNEMFPFYNNGYLYFSSDRPGGKGKLDIYRCSLNNLDFGTPEPLRNPINSSADDFGLWASPNNKWGYFTSNRGNSEDDIYWFTTDPPLFENCKPIEKPSYCFLFYEESSFESRDTSGMFYEWNFGDGAKARGLEVKHCFPGPGKYKVELNIVDKSSGAVFYNQVSYDFFIEGEKVVYFDIPDSVYTEKPVIFSPQLYSPTKHLGKVHYHWNFGDRTSSNKTITPHIFNEPGKYSVKLSVFESRGDSVFKTCVEKQIQVIRSSETTTLHQKDGHYRSDLISEPIRNPNKSLHDTILAENPKALQENKSSWKYDPAYKIDNEDTTYTYKVHLGTSMNKINPNDSIFKGLSPITYNKINDLYHYSYGNVHHLAESKPLFNQARKKGFENAIVVAFKDDSLVYGSNIEHLFKFIDDGIKMPDQSTKNISLIIFFGYGKAALGEEARRQLDKLIEQIKYKTLKTVRVTGHTDDSGSIEINDKISLLRAENVSEYLFRKGIDKSFISTSYMGSKQPLLPGDPEKNRNYNRRVEIEILF